MLWQTKTELIASKLSLKKLLKHVLDAEGKWPRQKIGSTKKKKKRIESKDKVVNMWTNV